MARKAKHASFDQMLNALGTRGFELSPFKAVAGGMQVTKNGVGAVLVPATTEGGSAAQLAVTPGIVVRGEIARLLDRGYQKFIKTAQFELPATATHLQAIHAFTEELNQVTGALGLYNESLGTTSDLYQYDRVGGRETPQPKATRPWELAGGH